MEDDNLIMKIVPITMAMLSNTILTLVSVYHNNQSPNTFFGMNLGTIFSNLIGYLLIISLNIGLGSEISKILTEIPKVGRNVAFRKIAICYQRALVVNFMCCVIIVTPLLYLSKYTVIWFHNMNIHIEMFQITSSYLFQLAPSIYFFAFFDTTRVYLEAQGVRVAPMLILMCATVMHYFLSQFLINNLEEKGMGAAWAKNITDGCCAIILYLYIKYSQVVKKTWDIEWDIDCMFNWKFHFKTLQKMGMTTYIEAVMFAVFFIIGGFSLQTQDLKIHISFLNWSQVFFVIFLGIKQGVINHIRQNKHNIKQKVSVGIKVCLSVTVILNFLMIIYKDSADSFFIEEKTFNVPITTYLVFIMSNFIDSLQICVAGLLKSIDNSNYILVTNILCYSNGLVFCYYLSYKLGWNIQGLWLGWSFGLLINFILCFKKLNQQIKIQERRISQLSSESIE